MHVLNGDAALRFAAEKVLRRKLERVDVPVLVDGRRNLRSGRFGYGHFDRVVHVSSHMHIVEKLLGNTQTRDDALFHLLEMVRERTHLLFALFGFVGL